MSNLNEKYLIRFISGTKANQIEEYDFDKSELSIGRGTNCDIQFDPETDLSVSREHGKIIKKAADLFVLEDNNSRNGTFVNGKKITGTVLLNPGDEVRLGSNGPAFVFDLSSREPSLMPTQLVSMSPATSTVDIGTQKFESKKTKSKFLFWLINLITSSISVH